jgi:hypothetical protein
MGGVQVVEGVEEVLLGVLLAPEELDIVDEQHVHAAESLAEFGRASIANGGDKLVGELLSADVEDVHPSGHGLVADGVQEVRLADARRTVQKQRVVGLAGGLRYLDGRRPGHTVAVTGYEGLERVGRIEQGRRLRFGLGFGHRRGHVEPCFDLATGQAGEDLLDERTEIPVQELRDEGVGNPDDELPAVAAQAHGAAEPCVIVGPVDLDLQLAQSGFPYLLCRPGCHTVTVPRFVRPAGRTAIRHAYTRNRSGWCWRSGRGDWGSPDNTFSIRPDSVGEQGSS